MTATPVPDHTVWRHTKSLDFGVTSVLSLGDVPEWIGNCVRHFVQDCGIYVQDCGDGRAGDRGPA